MCLRVAATPPCLPRSLAADHPSGSLRYRAVWDLVVRMSSLEDLGSVGHALSALSYGRDTAACCAAEIAVHACQGVSQSSRGDLMLFLMAAPVNGQSAVLLYGGEHARLCDNAEQNNIATGMRLIIGSLRSGAPSPEACTQQQQARPDTHSLGTITHSTSSRPDGGGGGSWSSTPPALSASHGLPARPPVQEQPGAPRAPPLRGPSSAALVARPMARLPDLLSFSPMVGPSYDPAIPFELSDANKVTIPESLSLSLLERLRQRFANDRALCKHFLKPIRHGVAEFLASCRQRTARPRRPSSTCQ